jgi:hypothetical protein
MLASVHCVTDLVDDAHTDILEAESDAVLITLHCVKLQYELEHELAPAVQLTNNDVVALNGLLNCMLEAALAVTMAGVLIVGLFAWLHVQPSVTVYWYAALAVIPESTH